MKKLFQNKTTLIIIIALVVVITIYILGRRAGKRNVEGPQINLPNGTANLPVNWRADVLAKELHDVMSGSFTLSGTKDAVWKKYIDLPTPDMQISVYNTFNQLYFNQGEGTLADWVRAEYYYDYVSGIKNELLQKFTQLNLP